MQSISPLQSLHRGPRDLPLTANETHQFSLKQPSHGKPLRREEFEVAIICALPLEYDAVCFTFDEFWDEDGDTYGSAPGDFNEYTTGRIGDQNVVLALLKRMGKASAASAVARLKLSYTGLQQAFLVGVCGGVPKTHDGVDIMLGDVIIGKSIVQYDFGKKYPDKFVRKYSFKESFGGQKKDTHTQSVLAMIATIRGRDKIRRSATKFLGRLQAKATENGYGSQYDYPGLVKDELFEASYRHKHHESPHCICKDCHEPTSPVCDEAINTSCKELGCNRKYLVPRSAPMNRQGQERVKSDREQVAIHVGSIASGDTVMKSGVDRDRIAEKEGVIAFEMEGAGIWEELPCIIVKGVSDYADSHKHSDWQNFAAATAAATMNALLMVFADKEKAQLEIRAWTAALQALDPGDRKRALDFVLFTFGQQPQLIRQVSFSPVLVIDARGTCLPFHLETIPSKELFIHILETRFADIGTRKIQRGEWFLEDQDSKRKLDLSKPWLSVIKPFSVLKMSMVFRRRNESRTECPSCHFTNREVISDEIQCRICGLSYRRVEELQNINISKNLSQLKTFRGGRQSKSSMPHEPRSTPPLPEPPRLVKPSDFEHDIGRYKHVQLVDVNFKIDMSGSISAPESTALTIKIQDLQDTNRLANMLSEVYGLSEQDSLNLVKTTSIFYLTQTPSSTDKVPLSTRKIQHDAYKGSSDFWDLFTGPIYSNEPLTFVPIRYSSSLCLQRSDFLEMALQKALTVPILSQYIESLESSLQETREREQEYRRLGYQRFGRIISEWQSPYMDSFDFEYNIYAARLWSDEEDIPGEQESPSGIWNTLMGWLYPIPSS